jgi:hypothetical protein
MTYTTKGKGFDFWLMLKFCLLHPDRFWASPSNFTIDKHTNLFHYDYVTVVASLYQYYAGSGVIFGITDVSTINYALVGLSGDDVSQLFKD